MLAISWTSSLVKQQVKVLNEGLSQNTTMQVTIIASDTVCMNRKMVVYNRMPTIYNSEFYTREL